MRVWSHSQFLLLPPNLPSQQSSYRSNPIMACTFWALRQTQLYSRLFGKFGRGLLVVTMIVGLQSEDHYWYYWMGSKMQTPIQSMEQSLPMKDFFTSITISKYLAGIHKDETSVWNYPVLDPDSTLNIDKMCFWLILIYTEFSRNAAKCLKVKGRSSLCCWVFAKRCSSFQKSHITKTIPLGYLNC